MSTIPMGSPDPPARGSAQEAVVSPAVAQSIRAANACELCKAPRRRRCRNKRGMPMTHVHQVRVLADLFNQQSTTNTEQGAQP